MSVSTENAMWRLPRCVTTQGQGEMYTENSPCSLNNDPNESSEFKLSRRELKHILI